MTRLFRIMEFMVLGAALGGVGGLFLPGLHVQETSRLGFWGLVQIGLLGALMASAGPLLERNWKKLLAACLTGAAFLVLLVLAVLGVAQLPIGGFAAVVVIIVAAGLFPAIVACTDCLVDELYRAILYETTFSALGGMVGLAIAWHWTGLANERLQLVVPAAIYSAVIWLGMGLAKRVEESEEKLEAREEAESEAP